jgi:chemotaxis protein methyltransferase CheR
VLTYFAEELQRQVIQRIVEHIVPGGFLVVGKHETLPDGIGGLLPYRPDLGVYRSLEPPKQGRR